MFKLLVADLDSPSYFVATAAAELGCFKEEGIEVELVRDYGAEKGPALLRAGTVHFLGGPAYIASQEFPDCKGAKLICALSQYSYWFLAVRADLDVRRGDINGLKGLRISASQPWPELASDTCSPMRVSTQSETMCELCHRQKASTHDGRDGPASKRSSKILPTPIGATACGPRSVSERGLRSSISIFVVAMVRPGRAGTTSRL